MNFINNDTNNNNSLSLLKVSSRPTTVIVKEILDDIITQAASKNFSRMTQSSAGSKKISCISPLEIQTKLIQKVVCENFKLSSRYYQFTLLEVLIGQFLVLFSQALPQGNYPSWLIQNSGVLFTGFLELAHKDEVFEQIDLRIERVKTVNPNAVQIKPLKIPTKESLRKEADELFKKLENYFQNEKQEEFVLKIQGLKILISNIKDFGTKPLKEFLVLDNTNDETTHIARMERYYLFMQSAFHFIFCALEQMPAKISALSSEILRRAVLSRTIELMKKLKNPCSEKSTYEDSTNHFVLVTQLEQLINFLNSSNHTLKKQYQSIDTDPNLFSKSQSLLNFFTKLHHFESILVSKCNELLSAFVDPKNTQRPKIPEGRMDFDLVWTQLAIGCGLYENMKKSEDLSDLSLGVSSLINQAGICFGILSMWRTLVEQFILPHRLIQELAIPYSICLDMQVKQQEDAYREKVELLDSELSALKIASNNQCSKKRKNDTKKHNCSKKK